MTSLPHRVSLNQELQWFLWLFAWKLAVLHHVSTIGYLVNLAVLHYERVLSIVVFKPWRPG
jgi:hypothetical protein